MSDSRFFFTTRKFLWSDTEHSHSESNDARLVQSATELWLLDCHIKNAVWQNNWSLV